MGTSRCWTEISYYNSFSDSNDTWSKWSWWLDNRKHISGRRSGAAWGHQMKALLPQTPANTFTEQQTSFLRSSVQRESSASHSTITTMKQSWNDHMCSCSTKAVISNTAIFVAIDNKSKLYIFLLCQKSLGY